MITNAQRTVLPTNAEETNYTLSAIHVRFLDSARNDNKET